MVLTQTLLIFAALLQLVLVSAGLHIVARRMYKTSADAQGLSLASLREEIVLAKCASCSS